MGKLWNFFKVLKAGECLADPATWKVRQNIVNAIVGLVGALLAMFPKIRAQFGFSDEDILTVAGAVAVFAGMFNNYITTATTRKIGVQTGSGNNDERGQDPSSDSENKGG
jgi:hypothetical protein